MKIVRQVYLIIFFISSLPSMASQKAEKEEVFNPNELVNHHILDAYSWDFFIYDEKHFSLPLPIILYTSQGWILFLSDEFSKTEDGIVTKNGLELQLSHGHIVELGGENILDISITKNTISMFLASLLLIITFLSVSKSYKKRGMSAPKGFQNLMESLIQFIIDDIAKPNIGKNYDKYLPFLLCLFFFIFFNNLLGLLPTGANTSGNISFTLTLAVFSLLVIIFSAKKHYWHHILWPPGISLPVKFILIPVEILGIFTKPFALMIRLFANITAGHTVILSLISIIFIFKSVFLGIPVGIFTIMLTFLELFVAILQAYIFTLLTALFIGEAVKETTH